jgi:hypothetical protein
MTLLRLVSSTVFYRGHEPQNLKKRHCIHPAMQRHILKHRNYHSHGWKTPKTYNADNFVDREFSTLLRVKGDVIERDDSGLLVR